MNHFIKSVAIESCQVELVIWDNTGINENDRLRRLSYKDVHMLLICFDISDPDSFENVEYMWNAEAAQFLARVPKVLVGCKKDLRNSTQTLSRLRRQDMMPISPYAVCMASFMMIAKLNKNVGEQASNQDRGVGIL